MRADIFLTNTSDKAIAVGITTIAPGKTERILEKDFERKASYVSRMIKEKKLEFPKPDLAPQVEEDVPAPANDTTEDVSGKGAPEMDPNPEAASIAGEDTNSDSEPVNTDETDASTATEKEGTTDMTEDEAEAELEVVKEVPAPKRT